MKGGRGLYKRTQKHHPQKGQDAVCYEDVLIARRLNSPNKYLARFVCYVHLSTVKSIESDNKRTKLNMFDGNIYALSATLAQIQAMLGDLVWLARRDLLVPTSQVCRYSPVTQSLILSDGSHIKVSRRRACLIPSVWIETMNKDTMLG